MKFRTKILLCLVLVLSLSLGIGGSLLIHASFQTTLEAELYNGVLAYQIAASALELSGQTGADALAQTLQQTQQLAKWDGVRLRQNGRTLYQLGSHFADLALPAAVGECTSVLFDPCYIQLVGIVPVGEASIELTLVWSSVACSDRDWMLAVYHTIFLITVSAGGLLCWAIAQLLTRPLIRMSRAAKKIAAGDLSARVAYGGGDEMGQLAADFNHMADRLQENIRIMEETIEGQERFMGSFAHELKTPMTSIIGYADLLRTQALSGSDAQEAANYIFSEARRLESLGLKLLALLVEKNDTPVLEAFSVPDMVYGLVLRLKPVYQTEGIHLTCQCQKGFCTGDADLLCSVLMNLIDNARKALPGGGKIHVAAKFEGQTCKLLVIDNGRGIPQDALSHLAEAFYRVDKSRSRAQGGAGLGLTLCQKIVSSHGGQMKFYSKLGEGTCVVVSLPCKAEEA